MKQKKLKKIIKDSKKVAVAFSGGVDSTYLLKIASDVLGENVIAVTSDSPSISRSELIEAKNFCKENKIKHHIFKGDELDKKDYTENPSNRCYFCKKYTFSKILNEVKKFGIDKIFEGSNFSDMNDYRPGKIAISELGIRSPLKEVRLTKDEIREYSKKLNLKTWNKPALACLSSRITYGEKITKEKLNMIEQAEKYLLSFGFSTVRVRISKNDARIEVPEKEISKILSIRKECSKKFSEIGFDFSSVDLDGYKMGNLNKTLKRNKTSKQ